MEFNFADIYEAIADRVPERTALVTGDVRTTYAELDEQANRLAHLLQSRGIGQGDHVGGPEPVGQLVVRPRPGQMERGLQAEPPDLLGQGPLL